MANKGGRPRRKIGKNTKGWVSTTVLCEKFGVSRWYLSRRQGTVFKEGKHFRNIAPTRWRPTYRWNLAACHKVLNEGTDGR